MLVAMPCLLVFWKKRGRYPALPTASRPDDGPAIQGEHDRDD